VRSTVGQRARFRIAGTSGEAIRMVPGKPEASLLYLRMASRHPVAQMPPMGTHIVDEQGLDRLHRWIAEGLPPSTSTHDKESTP
jgi:hypothetical protein